MEQQNMKTVDVTKLEGTALEYAVCAAIDGFSTYTEIEDRILCAKNSKYSTSWMHGGPLIERHRIEVIFAGKVTYAKVYEEKDAAGWGSTPLIAVCRALVLHKLGDTISVPDELINQQ